MSLISSTVNLDVLEISMYIPSSYQIEDLLGAEEDDVDEGGEDSSFIVTLNKLRSMSDC